MAEQEHKQRPEPARTRDEQPEGAAPTESAEQRLPEQGQTGQIASRPTSAGVSPRARPTASARP